jgi:LmbE family N-acetylglucosaminyl deacetylase
LRRRKKRLRFLRREFFYRPVESLWWHRPAACVESHRVFYERSILVIGAHPDDAVLGAGGVMLQSTQAGMTVRMLTLSSGELGGTPFEREAEDLRAAEIVGAAVAFGRLADGAMTQPDVIRAISGQLAASPMPFMVFAPDPNDTHQDHVIVGQAAIAACRGIANLFFYEGPTTIGFEAHCTRPCGDVWTKKIAAIAAHRSQTGTRELIEWAEATARYRAWPRHTGERCEAFRIHHAEFASFLSPAQIKSATSVTGDFSVSKSRS